LELRIFFERALLELAAQRASGDDVNRLQAHVDAFRAWATPRATHDELTRRDFEFHHLVAEIAGSPLLETLYEAFVRVFDKALHRLPKEVHISRVLVHHQKMVDCIRARQDDPAVVRKLVEASLDVWWQSL
jgi:DNA-binding FadR family transcriptional regulator